MIKVKNLKMSFGKKLVFSDINIDFSPGQFYAILGENGAGKSTFLNIISGRQKNYEGQVETFDIGHLKEINHLYEDIAYVSEDIIFDMKVNMKIFFDHYAKMYKNWDWDYFNYLIEHQNLDLKLMPKEYSRGQKMQLALIAGLAHKPKILFIDEITSVLDIYARKFYFEELEKIKKDDGLILMTTNIVHELDNIATHVCVFNDKKIVVNKSIDELRNEFIKLRRQNEDHQIFFDKSCRWIGKNSDQTDSYIISKIGALRHKIDGLEDRRLINISDVFLFYSESYEDDVA